jgi:alpha-tubulin N-acetyltransferase 1
MEFNFDLGHVFRQEIVVIGQDMLPQGGLPETSPNKNVGLAQQRVMEILDRMGEASARAQDLRQPITTATKYRSHPEHSIFLLVEKNAVVGLLKVGKKNLFLIDRQGDQNEVYPLCVLDFYVHEAKQRSGCGKRLFEAMLERHKTHPRNMAIDRPSPKLLGFMRKYFNLSNIIQQVNNYVVFDGFFANEEIYSSPGPRKARIYMGKLQYV